MRWTVLVPMRALPNAKSRLAATLSPDAHGRLVAAIRADTLAAVRAVPQVARVLVVGDVEGEGIDLVQTSSGLNGALRDGAEYAGRHWPGDGIAALVGDLPALRAEELAAALDDAVPYGLAYVPDASGTGTTLLTALPEVELEPRFGEGSAARHDEIAFRLDAGPGLRHDVDTAEDLTAATAAGLGPHTAEVVGHVAPRSP